MERVRGFQKRIKDVINSKEHGAEQGSASKKDDVSRYPNDLTKGTFASKSFDELKFPPGVEERKYIKYQREYFSPNDIGLEIRDSSGQKTSWQEHLQQQEREHDDVPQSYNHPEDIRLRSLREDIKQYYNEKRRELKSERGQLKSERERLKRVARANPDINFNHERRQLDYKEGQLNYKEEEMLEARSRSMQYLKEDRNLAATTAEYAATMRSRREPRERFEID